MRSETTVMRFMQCGLETAHRIEHVGAETAFDARLPTDPESAASILALRMCSVRWLLNGFPSVEVGHKLAAALMCTVPIPEAELRSPWDAFLLHVPSGLCAPPGDSLLGEFTHVLAAHFSDNDVWTLLLAFSSGLMFPVSRRLDELIGVPAGADQVFGDGCVTSIGRADEQYSERASTCAVRYFVNVCAAMADRANVQRVGKGNACEPFSESAPRAAVEPRGTTFRLGTPVRIDCREEVRAYLAGTRRNPAAVQWMVRGHWTHQPHGPERSLRRLQWIGPYWKGREGAPINLRPHTIGAL
jgi:hypothetical protein